MTQKDRTGIAVAGNLLVDRLYPVSHFPGQGELSTVTGAAASSTGGCVCNVAMDLALLAPDMPVYALGLVGDDENGRFIRARLGRIPNLRLDGLRTRGMTGYTLVMAAEDTHQRTFFTYAGANGEFDESAVPWEELPARMLHVGYALLLEKLDQPDPEYGVGMARLLHMAQARGIQTSLDTVSEAVSYTHLTLPTTTRV